jgi:hypothetical protein
MVFGADRATPPRRHCSSKPAELDSAPKIFVVARTAQPRRDLAGPVEQDLTLAPGQLDQRSPVCVLRQQVLPYEEQVAPKALRRREAPAGEAAVEPD